MMNVTIKYLRNQMRMTQSQFAKWLEIPLRSIENWESGASKPAPYLVKLIEYRVDKEAPRE